MQSPRNRAVVPVVAAGLSILASALTVACGASLPDRYVVEENLGDFSYRRYQKTMDVEFPVEGNPAVGHTASYVLRDRTSREVRFATAFVTVYEKAPRLTAEVRARLNTLGSYEVEVGELEGENVWWLDGGDDLWALWVSGRYVVKLGSGSADDIPEDIAEAYTDLYPSDLDEHGRAEDGSASAGRARGEEEEEDGDLGIPRHLREGAPQ